MDGRGTKRWRGQSGFTLIELMMVVGIIGLLSSVAIPAFTQYLKKSKTVEATSMLNKIASGAQLYFQRETILPNGNSVGFKLPLRSKPSFYPPKSHNWACNRHGGAFPTKQLKQFSDDPWRALNFQPEGLIRYRYHWWPVKQHTRRRGALARAEALGDLDCDKVYARWRLQLVEDRKNAVLTRRGPFIISGDELE